MNKKSPKNRFRQLLKKTACIAFVVGALFAFTISYVQALCERWDREDELFYGRPITEIRAEWEATGHITPAAGSPSALMREKFQQAFGISYPILPEKSTMIMKVNVP